MRELLRVNEADDTDVRAGELPPTEIDTYGGFAGECRITGYQDGRPETQVTVRLHTLGKSDGRDEYVWPDQFLSAWMTSLGGDLTGMASPNRSWVALPESCTGNLGRLDAHTVVDVATGFPGTDSGLDGATNRRDLLARVAVQVANGAMAELGCEAELARPSALPTTNEPRTVRPDRVCGLSGADGFEVPPDMLGKLEFERLSGGDSGPARVCELANSDQSIHEPGSTGLRLTTVTDPHIGDIFLSRRVHDAPGIDGTEGYWSPGRAVGQLSCPAGPVTVVAEQRNELMDTGFTLTRDLLPRYLKSEGKRLDCRPVDVEMPR